MTRVLVTGGAGTVARHLVLAAPDDAELVLTERNTPVAGDVAARAAAIERVDLRDRVAVQDLLRRSAADVVVHTAYSSHERSDVVDASAAVAGACAQQRVELVHLSTDVVFGGTDPPYAEGAPLDPVSDYGRWKAQAEATAVAAVPSVCITRTSLVVALDPPDRSSGALLRALAAGEPVQLFHDEWRQPIRAGDLAAELWALLALPGPQRAGVWHLPGPEVLSRMELGLRLAEAAGVPITTVRAASVAEHPTPRPADLTLAAVRRDRLGVQLHPVP